MTAPAVAGGPGGRAGGAERDSKLEGLRGYLALGVVVFHVAFFAGITSFIGMPTKGFWTVLVDGLVVCLPPFFVLSGFFLYRPFARAILAGTRRPAARPFWMGRALRLIPAYWLVVVVALLAINLNVIDGFWYVARPFLMVHFYVPGVPWVTGLVPTWTVPAELLYYLLLPAIAIWITRRARRAATPEARKRRMIRPLGLFVLIGLLWTVLTNLPGMVGIAWWFNMWYWPFGYFDAFAIGMGLATVSAYAQVTGRTPAMYRFVSRRPNVFWAAAAVVFVVNLNRSVSSLGLGDYGAMTQEIVIHVLVLIFAFLLVAPLTVPGVKSRLMERTLTFRPIRFVGRISYGVYLWHMVVVALLLRQGNLFGNAPADPVQLFGVTGFWWLVTATVAGTVVVSTVSYYAVERPLTRLRARRRWTAVQDPVQEPVVAVLEPAPDAGRKAA